MPKIRKNIFLISINLFNFVIITCKSPVYPVHFLVGIRYHVPEIPSIILPIIWSTVVLTFFRLNPKQINRQTCLFEIRVSFNINSIHCGDAQLYQIISNRISYGLHACYTQNLSRSRETNKSYPTSILFVFAPFIKDCFYPFL